jgi:hypothetical protein
MKTQRFTLRIEVKESEKFSARRKVNALRNSLRRFDARMISCRLEQQRRKAKI